jgi:hypothetical protein
VQSVFLPAFAVWAQELGRLEANFVQSIMDRLNNLITVSALIFLKENSSHFYVLLTQKQPPSSLSKTCGVVPGDKQRFCLYMQTLSSLVPIMFSAVLTQGPYVSRADSARAPEALICKFYHLQDVSITLKLLQSHVNPKTNVV